MSHNLYIKVQKGCILTSETGDTYRRLVKHDNPVKLYAELANKLWEMRKSIGRNARMTVTVKKSANAADCPPSVKRRFSSMRNTAYVAE